MHCSFIYHSVFAVEQSVIAHKDEDGVVKLPELFEGGVEGADAIVYGEDCSPVGAGHSGKIFYAFGGGVGEVFAPFK